MTLQVGSSAGKSELEGKDVGVKCRAERNNEITVEEREERVREGGLDQTPEIYSWRVEI